jgi:hypothetical protein
MTTPRFRKLLKLSPLQDGKWWVLLEDVQYNGFVVPKGFTTDFASTPRFLWWLLPPYGRYAAAAIVHDFLYHRGVMTRTTADRVFLEAMGSLGVLLGVRYAMWAAVRAFGWMAWRANALERWAGCDYRGCSIRCARILDQIPEELGEVRPRGLERVWHWLHGRAA